MNTATQTLRTPPAQPAVVGERRRESDRRKKHVLFSDWRYAIRGRRRGQRRSAADLESGVDFYRPQLMFMAVAIMVLSALDATFTLMLMQAGMVEEWNPLMRALINADVQLFANVKIAVTAFGLIFLVALYHGRVGRVRMPVAWILRGTFAGYSLLICYELALLSLR